MMIIHFGDHCDCWASLERPRQVILVVYGDAPSVIRDDQTRVTPLRDETEYRDLRRIFVRLVPYGDNALAPFGDDNTSWEDVEETDTSWSFRVQYGDGKELTVRLVASFADEIDWLVHVVAGAHTIELGAVPDFNPYAWEESGLSPARQEIELREAMERDR